MGELIGYIRDRIPEFEVPSCRGQRYEATVPDTLDLQERATLTVHGLTEPTDPEADYEIYWRVLLDYKPAAMRHDWCDLVQSKFQEGLPLMRIASGSGQNPHVERAWMEASLRQVGPDGLLYIPVRGRSWARLNTQIYGGTTESDQLYVPFYNGRMLEAFTVHALRDDNPIWRETIRGIVDGLAATAVDDGRAAWYWPSCFRVDPVRPSDATIPTHWVNCEIRAVPLGLVYAYKLLGYEPALALAGKVNTYERDQFFGADASFIANQQGEGKVHFHAHTASLLAMLEYAQIVGDDDLKEFVVRGYEYAKANGEPLLGYFPEFLRSPELEHSEICEVADMMALGLKLSEFGIGDYWDDVDRWTRNMFAEGQLTRTDWIARLTEGQPKSAIDPTYQTTGRVAERNLGSFAGWPSANDWYIKQNSGIMHCCTGNAARSLYQVWECIVEYSDGQMRVNLLLNRASPWADVDSYIPYEGRVDVRVKQATELSVRIPEWVEPRDAVVRVGDSVRPISWNGRYAQVGAVKPGDVVTLTFPIGERTDTVYVEKERYTIVRKGNEVVAIDPPGKYCPLYQRDHYRASTVRWRKIERFVSEERIHW